MGYSPSLASLKQHPVPTWYDDAKFGIFIHWGLFSVPAFAPQCGSIHEVLAQNYDDFVVHTPYTEWYQNAVRFPDSPSAEYHRKTYGDQPYADFRKPFGDSLAHWDPDAWADLFAEAGARYVVLVTKHHDGYCLWPSQVANPNQEGWTTARDLVSELARSVRSRGLRFGVYYSGGIDWSFNPEPLRTATEFMASIPDSESYRDYADRQVRELIDLVEPDILWNDIAWPTEPPRLWRLFADYYNAVPEGLVNDRWATPNAVTRMLRNRVLRGLIDRIAKRWVRGKTEIPTPPPPPHCDYRTPEYTSYSTTRRKKWECVRGMGNSFAYNRFEPPDATLSLEELVHSFVDMVAKNGNLLLNVGPRGEDAAIPEHQSERLREFGAWLRRNGSAIYATRPFSEAEGRTEEGLPVRYTAKPDRLYAIVLGTPSRESIELVLPENLSLEGQSEVPCSVLGVPEAKVLREGKRIHVELPGGAPTQPAFAIEIPRIAKTP